MLVSRAVLQFAAALALTLSIVNVSHAGPVERMADIALHPTNPDVLVIRYQNGGTGLLYTSDGGRNFQLLCSAAIDRGKPTGPIAITKEGNVLLGTFEGMWRDDGKGCGWSKIEPLTGRWITDIVTDPTDPGRMLTVSGNGGEGVKNGLARSAADNQWMDIGTQDALGITRVRGVKTDGGMRLYQSVLRVDPPGDDGVSATAYLLRVSDDEGKTWREHEVPVNTIASFRLEAIDPTNPDHLVGSIVSERESDQVLVSTDQGATWKPYLEVSDLGGVAFAPDGRLWIGEPSSLGSSAASRGLWYAPKLDMAPTKVYEADGVECVAYQPATDSLIACRSFSFGKFDTKDWTFTESFHFKAAKDFVRCDGMDMPAVCEAQLCADYCGAGHFAQSQLCCVYDTPSCGAMIAESEGTGGPSMCSSSAGGGGGSAAGSTAGSAASAGTGASGAAGSTPGSAGAAGAAPTAGSTAEPPTPPNDDGCSCSAPGRRSVDGRALAWLGVLAFGALVIRRRRRPNVG